MIVVADSGSTKCDWVLIKGPEMFIKTHTMGFNPFFHNKEVISGALQMNKEIAEYKNQVKEIYFYGAGCSSYARNAIVEDALRAVFVNVELVKVDHDLTGAALATAQDAPGIACIIGTGSNSCYFDGEKVHESVPALGYILGDEGSGSYFGKILLSKFLYNKLPLDLAEELKKQFNLNKEEIFLNVYNKPNPNVYLASFMKFISDNREHPFFKDMIYKGMASFINIHVWCFDNFREVPVHFVGSIAYYFREVLEEVAKNHRFTVGKIEQRPVEPLAHYHLNKRLEQIT